MVIHDSLYANNFTIAGRRSSGACTMHVGDGQYLVEGLTFQKSTPSLQIHHPRL